MSHCGALLIAQEIIVCCTELRDDEDVPGACITLYVTSVQFTSNNLTICLRLLFGHGKDCIVTTVTTLLGTLLLLLYAITAIIRPGERTLHTAFPHFTRTTVFHKVVFWVTALMALEIERERERGRERIPTIHAVGPRTWNVHPYDIL